MDEHAYWVRLEYRVCDEFAGMPEKALQYLWCDGFIPECYLLDDATPRITGRAWICNVPRQDEWEFTLFLPGPVAARAVIHWTSLLPPENVTRWLALDLPGRRIQISPRPREPAFARFDRRVFPRHAVKRRASPAAK